VTRLAAALLAATALLAGGAQALAPATAAAAINQGEECDLNNPTADCESTNGGGGGGSTGGGSAGGEEIVGEAIYVEGTPPPSPCGIGCLPSQIGGSRTGFLDRGGRDPRGPRPRGRLTRVGEVAKGKAPTKEECEKLMAGRLKLPSDLEMKAASARIVVVGDANAGRKKRLEALQREADRLTAELKRPRAPKTLSRDEIAAKQRQLADTVKTAESVQREVSAGSEEFARLVNGFQDLQRKRRNEIRALLKQCGELRSGR
jgi:hypothetical protein